VELIFIFEGMDNFSIYLKSNSETQVPKAAFSN
jgi:hypothetical protein